LVLRPRAGRVADLLQAAAREEEGLRVLDLGGVEHGDLEELGERGLGVAGREVEPAELDARLRAEDPAVLVDHALERLSRRSPLPLRRERAPPSQLRLDAVLEVRV